MLHYLPVVLGAQEHRTLLWMRLMMFKCVFCREGDAYLTVYRLLIAFCLCIDALALQHLLRHLVHYGFSPLHISVASDI